MRMLTIECASEACSIALFEGDALVAARHEVLGRGHAEHLVPLIASLPGKGRAGAIRVSLGPGSFTGVRIGLAAARALGLAWGAAVLGYPTLALVAAQNPEGEALVCMAGGHGQWFVQPFRGGLPQGPLASLRPADAAAGFGCERVIGSRAQDLVSLRGYGTASFMLPDASAASGLPKRLLTSSLAPLYGRPPDARLPA
ncbi:tRNA (adenosine(37)-N6)-threonylcarbamoyltransferase complex dimerization subunit type 1 TsaB [Qipengyuania sediminis]|uniref:tRNA (adenosine(37)-N6)-threonylcarbamoyltransferase complex dimerization subunit type 1 TsaB n=1 Tax=Qipengyuania sediminis TaxID=1532023 RepID=UPI00105A68B1|nr:tRNA (adenosine(37)-N6)-threonylcarbamoyltransferase complex dimerization subunit type 1 TsaB [Qipengyuania sediminis]